MAPHANDDTDEKEKPARMYRIPNQILTNGDALGVIIDRGVSAAATPISESGDSNYNFYNFGERTPATLPLGIVGSRNAIIQYLKSNPEKGILNKIEELPQIYMMIYHIVSSPKKDWRYQEISVLDDILKNILTFNKSTFKLGKIIDKVRLGLEMGYKIKKSFSKDTPIEEKKFNVAVSTINKLAPFLKDTGLIVNRSRSKFKDDTPLEHTFCLKFDYLPDDDMILIGEKKVLFKDVLDPAKDWSRIFNE